MTTTSRSVAIEANARCAIAAEAMLHPIALVAVAVLVLNDHVLKAAFPGAVTGKLSDFAGLALVPLLLQALVELAIIALHARVVPSRPLLLAATGLTAVGFTLVKTTPAFADAYRFGLGGLQWLVLSPIDWLDGAPVRTMSRVSLARDVTDLIALPASLAGLLVPRGGAVAREP